MCKKNATLSHSSDTRYSGYSLWVLWNGYHGTHGFNTEDTADFIFPAVNSVDFGVFSVMRYLCHIFLYINGVVYFDGKQKNSCGR